MRAAAQQANRTFTSSTSALAHLGSLAGRLAGKNDGLIQPSGHLLFLVCPDGDRHIIRAVTPKGALEDHPETEDLDALLASVRVLANRAGIGALLDKPTSASLGAWPLLFSVGLEPDAVGRFRWGSRMISFSPGRSVASAAAIHLHEVAHFALGTARDLDADQIQQFGKAPVRLLNEAFAFTIQYAAAYALALDGDRSFWQAWNHIGYEGTPYRTIAQLVAYEFPDLATAVRRDQRVPNAFLQRLFEEFARLPTAEHINLLTSRHVGAPISDLSAILPRVYFLDAASRQRVTATVTESAWFAAQKNRSDGAAMLAAAREAETKKPPLRAARLYRQFLAEWQRVEARAAEPLPFRGAHELTEIMRLNAKAITPALLASLEVKDADWEALKAKITMAAQDETAAVLDKISWNDLHLKSIAELEAPLWMANAHMQGWAARQPKVLGHHAKVVGLQDLHRRLFIWAAFARVKQTRSVEHTKVLIERLVRVRYDLTFLRSTLSDTRSAEEIAASIGLRDRARQITTVSVPGDHGVPVDLPIAVGLQRIGLKP
jgi:hypothetical protein